MEGDFVVYRKSSSDTRKSPALFHRPLSLVLIIDLETLICFGGLTRLSTRPSPTFTLSQTLHAPQSLHNKSTFLPLLTLLHAKETHSKRENGSLRLRKISHMRKCEGFGREPPTILFQKKGHDSYYLLNETNWRTDNGGLGRSYLEGDTAERSRRLTFKICSKESMTRSSNDKDN
jgi:hypothetical protein